MDEIIPWTFMSNDLVKAVSSGDVETVEELINNGADLNAYDSFGNSLLWIGYINNYHEIIFMLLNAGINVNAKSGKLYMCDMHRASAFGNLNFVELLLACNGDVNIEDINGKTPLILSVEYRYNNYCIELIELLIRKGAKVNHQDVQGFSALHHACQRAWIDVIELLIKNNGDPCLQNSLGHSPLSYALTNVCYTHLDDCMHKLRLNIVDKLLSSLNYDFVKIKTAIFETKLGLNLHSLFDLIFFGLRNHKAELIAIGWTIFLSIKFYSNLEKAISIVANNLCQFNKSNFDVIYFLNNIQISDAYNLIIFYISRFSYEENVQRANILLHYCVLTDEGTGLKLLLKDHYNILVDSYINVFIQVLDSKSKTPSSLKCLSRNAIRYCLKYSIGQKLKSLEIPKNLCEYLLLYELYNLAGINSCEILKKIYF